jgi:hypothetical protein
MMAAHGGEEAGVRGDEVSAVFGSPRACADAAIQVQRARALSASDAREIPDKNSGHADEGGGSGIRDEVRRRPLHHGFRRPEAWFEALTDHQRGLLKSIEIITVEMTVSANHAGTTVGVLEIRHNPEASGRGVQAG